MNFNARKWIFAVAMFALADAAKAAEVTWDKISFSGAAIEWKSQDDRYWLYTAVSYSSEGESWTIVPIMAMTEYSGILYPAAQGDVVTASTGKMADPIFSENRPWISEKRDWTPVSGSGEADIFLAIILYDSLKVNDYEDSPIYGWLKLRVEDNSLALVSSALTYSPGLIVGTGDFAAIPEPSAGVLLLLGLAGLALRRRRPRPHDFCYTCGA